MIRKALGPRTWLTLAASSYSFPLMLPPQSLPLHQKVTLLNSSFVGQATKYNFSKKKKSKNNEDENSDKNNEKENKRSD